MSESISPPARISNEPALEPEPQDAALVENTEATLSHLLDALKKKKRIPRH